MKQGSQLICSNYHCLLSVYQLSESFSIFFDGLNSRIALQVQPFHLKAEVNRGWDEVKMASNSCSHYFSHSIASEKIADTMQFTELAYRKLREMAAKFLPNHFIQIFCLYHWEVREVVVGQFHYIKHPLEVLQGKEIEIVNLSRSVIVLLQGFKLSDLLLREHNLSASYPNLHQSLSPLLYLFSYQFPLSYKNVLLPIVNAICLCQC